MKITKKELIKIITEAVDKEIYFDTYSGAVQYAKKQVENRGISIDEEDWWNEITTGPGRPKDGQTVRHSISLYKNGKQLKKALHIQVYNRGNKIQNNYELNFYIA